MQLHGEWKVDFNSDGSALRRAGAARSQQHQGLRGLFEALCKCFTSESLFDSLCEALTLSVNWTLRWLHHQRPRLDAAAEEGGVLSGSAERCQRTRTGRQSITWNNLLRNARSNDGENHEGIRKSHHQQQSVAMSSERGLTLIVVPELIQLIKLLPSDRPLAAGVA